MNALDPVSKVRNQTDTKLNSLEATDQTESEKGNEDIEFNHAFKVGFFFLTAFFACHQPFSKAGGFRCAGISFSFSFSQFKPPSSLSNGSRITKPAATNRLAL